MSEVIKSNERWYGNREVDPVLFQSQLEVAIDLLKKKIEFGVGMEKPQASCGFLVIIAFRNLEKPTEGHVNIVNQALSRAGYTQGYYMQDIFQ